MRRGAAILLLATLATNAHPCTTFVMNVDGRVVFGQNYDWHTRVGLLMANKRSVFKTSYTQRPVSWTSRFASITFNQYGRDFPCGGMNEAGLIVALMDLEETQYPAVDERPSAGNLDWIQYQLDLAGSIDEAIANASAIRIATGSRPIHYLIADRSGRAVTIEYLNGTLVTHNDATLPVAVLANERYDVSLAYLSNITGFGGQMPPPAGPTSLARFARAASMIRTTKPGTDPVERAFEILDSVGSWDFQSGIGTRWSVVYDPIGGVIHYRTDDNREERWVALSSFDPACASSVQITDMNGPYVGDLASHFTNYTTSANIDLVRRAYAETPYLQAVSEESRMRFTMHSEGDTCAVNKRTRGVRH